MTTNPIAKACIIASALALCACESTQASPERSDSVDSQAVFDALFHHLDYRLPSEQQCSSEGTITVGEFTARSLTYISEHQAGKGTIETSCNAVALDASLANFYSMDMFPAGTDKALAEMEADAPLKQCRVSFSLSDQELVWSRAIQFLWNEKTEEALENTFRCLLTP